MNIIESTKSIKSFIHSRGIDIVGIADLSELRNIPVGLNIKFERRGIRCSILFRRWWLYGMCTHMSIFKEEYLI